MRFQETDEDPDAADIAIFANEELRLPFYAYPWIGTFDTDTPGLDTSALFTAAPATRLTASEAFYGDTPELAGPAPEYYTREYAALPVEVRLTLLRAHGEAPPELSAWPWEEFFRCAREYTEKTGLPALADDLSFPLALRECISSFTAWYEVDWRAGEARAILEGLREGVEQGYLVPAGEDALLEAVVVSGPSGADGCVLPPGPCVLAQGTFILRHAFREDGPSRSGEAHDFLIDYLASQDAIAWDAPGAGILADGNAYAGGCGDAGLQALWNAAMERAALPRWYFRDAEDVLRETVAELLSGESAVDGAIARLEAVIQPPQ